MQSECSFRSFFLGGFECSTHRLRNGKRLDVIAATQHDRFCERDYARLQEFGISSARDGIRWPLIETTPYRYNFSSLRPMLKAARVTGMQVIWDVCHYGWPDDIDIFSSEFIHRFYAFAREVARVVSDESSDTPFFTPMNEMSFFSWGGGDVAFFNPFEQGRGDELKAQLARANIAAIDAIRSVTPRARFAQVDPVINIASLPHMNEQQRRQASDYYQAQFAAWDIVAGRLHPHVGGAPQYLDIVGANYYVQNQWTLDGEHIDREHPAYRPLNDILGEVYRRYGRPIFIAETGIEDELRPEWLRYVCDETVIAIQRGIPVEGICLYPILNYPGWDDERHCCSGLWDYADDRGHREVYRPLADELMRQQARIEEVRLCPA